MSAPAVCRYCNHPEHDADKGGACDAGVTTTDFCHCGSCINPRCFKTFMEVAQDNVRLQYEALDLRGQIAALERKLDVSRSIVRAERAIAPGLKPNA